MNLLSITIRGKVHKTGMRYFLKQKAQQLKIRGRVYYINTHTLCVEALGNSDNLNSFITHCRTGNYDSVIHEIVIKETPIFEFASFEVLDNIMI